MSFKKGDIVEVRMPEDHPHVKYNGMVFEVIEGTTNYDTVINGKIISAPSTIPDRVGTPIKWGIPHLLVLVKKEEEKKEDKYLSPFSGQWV